MDVEEKPEVFQVTYMLDDHKKYHQFVRSLTPEQARAMFEQAHPKARVLYLCPWRYDYKVGD